MNIALFSDSYIPTKSGIVTVVIQLREALESLGHKVVIVTVAAHESEGFQKEDENVLRVTSIPSPIGDGQYIGFPHKKVVVDFLKKHNVEIIHSHTEFFMGHMAIVSGVELNIPVVASTHTMWEDYYKYYLSMGKIIPRKVVRKAVQLIYKKFYAFINVSKKAHDYFNRPYMLPHIPSAVIPNAINAKTFISSQCSKQKKDELKKKLGIKDTDRVILYVGRIVEEKRVLELLEIIKRVIKERSNAKMLFVGAGTAYDELVKRVNQANLQDRILFSGFVDWNELHLYYAISSIFVTVSLSEMHSMTILEALSLGLPVVCRKDTSFTDTVFHGEDGYFATSDTKMDSYLLELIDNPQKCEEFGKRALEISRNFTLDIHGKRTIAFYKKVLESFPNAVTSEELQSAVDKAIDVQ